MKDLIKMCLGTIKRIPLFLSQLWVRSQDIYIFGAWYGQKFSDNSKALFLFALKHTDKKCYWICKNRQLYKKLKSEGIPVFLTYSLRGILCQLSAGVAFSCTGDGDFCRFLLGNCMHVELWHGVGGGKKVGLDDREYREAALNKRGVYYTKLEKHPLRKRYFVCTSEAMKQVFKSAFLVPNNHFIYAGQPRNDMFFDEKYKIETFDPKRFAGKKIILYLPTHRKGGRVKMDMSRLLDLERLNQFCKENDCVFLIKKHFYHGKEYEDLEQYSNVYDLTHEVVDTNELLLLADYLISDYSSCTADYLLLKRPIFYYCYDFEEYISEDREMYWDYDDITPGSRSYTFDELMCNLEDTITQNKDLFVEDRERVCNLFYAPSSQSIASESILMQVEKLREQN